MLPKKYRLRLKNDFDRLFKEGKFVSYSFLTLGYIKNNLDLSRIAVIVGKKVSKKAVLRNSIKRRTVEIIRLNLKRIKPGFDIAFVAKPDIQKRKSKEIEGILYHLCIKARIVE